MAVISHSRLLSLLLVCHLLRLLLFSLKLPNSIMLVYGGVWGKFRGMRWAGVVGVREGEGEVLRVSFAVVRFCPNNYAKGTFDTEGN